MNPEITSPSEFHALDREGYVARLEHFLNGYQDLPEAHLEQSDYDRAAETGEEQSNPKFLNKRRKEWFTDIVMAVDMALEEGMISGEVAHDLQSRSQALYEKTLSESQQHLPTEDEDVVQGNALLRDTIAALKEPATV